MLAVYSLISLSVPQCKRSIIVTNESIVTSLASVKIVYQYIYSLILNIKKTNIELFVVAFFKSVIFNKN